MSITIQKADECPPLPMSALASALADLFNAADGLEQPVLIRLDIDERIDLQFDPEESLDAIASWAQRFNGQVLVISTRPMSNGGTARWIESHFDWHGILVEMYSMTVLDEPEHVDYPHEPGRLYGCPACEFRCHCTPGNAECVYDGPHTPPPF